MKSRKFTFAFDPRDISRLFFFDPETRSYSEVPFRDTSRGPVSIWEVRTARQRLSEEGKSHVDEAMIFDKIGDLRHDMEQRARKSKKLRREKQRVVQQAKNRTYIASGAVAAQLDAEMAQFDEAVDDGPVDPFDVEKL
jgi:putative transposase